MLDPIASAFSVSRKVDVRARADAHLYKGLVLERGNSADADYFGLPKGALHFKHVL